MSVSASLNVPSYLPMLLGSESPGTSLLATLSDYTTPVPGAIDPIAALERAKTGETRQVALVAADPKVKREVAQFTQALAAAKTPAQLLANPAALKVLLTASGLADQAGNTALARQALLSNPAQSGSLVNQLTDARWLSVNNACSFATKGLSLLNEPSTVAAVANHYAEEVWRTNLDQTTAGLSNAIDFEQRASTITDVGQVLNDPTFRTVVTTALGISGQVELQSQTAQEQAITDRVDLAHFKDPAFVTQVTQRYLVKAQQLAGRTAGKTDPTVSPAPASLADLATPALPSAGLVV